MTVVDQETGEDLSEKIAADRAARGEPEEEDRGGGERGDRPRRDRGDRERIAFGNALRLFPRLTEPRR